MDVWVVGFDLYTTFRDTFFSGVKARLDSIARG